MKFFSARILLRVLLPFLCVAPVFADQWTQPTPEELKMSSQPEVPGAAAVYLYREETTEDNLHMFGTYVRLKVLTEGGKKYADIELPYVSDSDNGSLTITDIAGRTIHPDGTIVPFTGKPYQKLIVKNKTTKYMAKVFSLPDVEVGSILEYRYKRRIEDNRYAAPQWYIQSQLFTRKAHYMWKPTDRQLVSLEDGGQAVNRISWTPILPHGVTVNKSEMPPTLGHDIQYTFTVDIQNVPPIPEEEYMPPMGSFSYRVLFYYTPYNNVADFWKKRGKTWDKTQDKFIGPGSGVLAAVQRLTSASDTQDQKLRKIYAEVMQFENTDFTRSQSSSEEKSQGLKQVRTSDDILSRRRGSSDELTELFVGMARAAGMNAYVMAVTNRDKNIFFENYMSLNQLDDDVAIVEVDGKERYFDPGSRYCEYGDMDWKHTMTSGLRQTSNGTAIGITPAEEYTKSRVQRIADLKMDEHGVVTGTIKMVYTGAPALHWRHVSLTGDRTSLENALQDAVEQLLPGGMDVKVANIEQLINYDQPLTVLFTLKGAIGSAAGKRLLLTDDLFEINTKSPFPHENRQTGIYFEYPYLQQDAIRISFPSTFTIESLPTADQQKLSTFALYSLKSESTPTSVTIRRSFALGNIIFLPKEYPDLRAFYNHVLGKDQESIVLKAGSAATSASSPVPTGR